MVRLVPVAALACFISGCATVDYVGESYQPTSQVDVFFAEHDVPREYKVIGQVLASGDQFVSAGALNTKLMARAREKGADAVIILAVTRTPMSSSADVTETSTLIDLASRATSSTFGGPAIGPCAGASASRVENNPADKSAMTAAPFQNKG